MVETRSKLLNITRKKIQKYITKILKQNIKKKIKELFKSISNNYFYKEIKKIMY